MLKKKCVRTWKLNNQGMENKVCHKKAENPFRIGGDSIAQTSYNIET